MDSYRNGGAEVDRSGVVLWVVDSNLRERRKRYDINLVELACQAVCSVRIGCWVISLSATRLVKLPNTVQ